MQLSIAIIQEGMSPMRGKLHNNNKIRAFLLALCILLINGSTYGVLGKSLSYTFENGINARIYTPEMIKQEMIRRDQDGSLVLVIERGWEYTLIEETSDPDIAFRGDGEFHPHRIGSVTGALSEVDVNGNIIDMEVMIYLLPYPRREIVNSTAAGCRIFLSPGVLEPDPEVSSYLVTHELGHCIQNKYLPLEDSEGWGIYIDLRGITGVCDYEIGTCSHREDPVEIFAEDFRYLFGGEGAVYNGGVENTGLTAPDEVAGLENFFCSLISGTGPDVPAGGLPEVLAAGNYPNPFNPSTTIKVRLSEEAAGRTPLLNISVYDIKGRLVREVCNRRVSGRDLSVNWDGRDRSGLPVSSGVYLYVVKTSDIRTTGKMLLVR